MVWSSFHVLQWGFEGVACLSKDRIGLTWWHWENGQIPIHYPVAQEREKGERISPNQPPSLGHVDVGLLFPGLEVQLWFHCFRSLSIEPSSRPLAIPSSFQYFPPLYLFLKPVCSLEAKCCYERLYAVGRKRYINVRIQYNTIQYNTIQYHTIQ